MTDILNDEMIPIEELLDKEKEGLGLIPGTSGKGDFYSRKKTPLPDGTHIVYTDDKKNTATYIIKRFVQRGGFALTYEVELVGLKGSRLILKEFCPKNARRHKTGTIENTCDENYSNGLSKFRREPDRIGWIRENLKNNKDLAEHVALSRTPVFNSKKGNSYFVQDFVEGETLMEFMSRPVNGDTPMSVSLALEIAVALCKAVSAIHNARIAHMDLAPGNIIFKRNKGSVELKVIDFGLSTNVDEKGGSGSAINGGTPGFLDQQLSQYSTKDIDFRNADVYSIGALLNYMLFFSYDKVRMEENGFAYNYDSMKDLSESQPYVSHPNSRDEYRRRPLVELIKKATQEVPKKTNASFRPNIDELLMELNRIKADMHFEENTLQQMKKAVPAKGDKLNIFLHTELPWVAKVEYPANTPSWIDLEKNSTDDANDRNIVVTIHENKEETPREAKIIIESGVIQETYTVRQDAGAHKVPGIFFPKGSVALSKLKDTEDEADVTFTATDDWTAVVSSEGYGWLSVSPDRDKAGLNTVKLKAKPNDKNEERQATITFTCGGKSEVWTARQEAAPAPFLEFAQGTITRRTVKCQGGPLSFTIHTNTDWKAQTLDAKDSNWIKMESDKLKGHAGIHTFNLTIAPNDKQVEREGQVVVSNNFKGKIFTIKQEPKPRPAVVVPPPQPTPAPQTAQVAEQDKKPTVVESPKPGTTEPADKPTVKADDKSTDKPDEPIKDPKGGSKGGNKKKSKSWAVWVVIGLLVAGVGFWLYTGLGSSNHSDGSGRDTVPSGVVQTGGGSQTELQQTDGVQGAGESKTMDVKAFNAAISNAMQGLVSMDNVLGLLHSSVTIYERYGNSDVQVGSSMRQLLQGEDVNIVLGETHRVTELDTDPASGLINEIIIEKKP